MRRWAAFLVALLAAPGPVLGQARDQAHIGYLASSSAASDAARTAAFKRGLAELGYVEGRNIKVEWRYPASADRLPEIVDELARRKVQVIVVGGATATRAVKSRVGTIPIVMTNVTDPVGLGLVKSLASPGGNLTGLTNVSVELNAKRVELLKEMVPGLSAIAVLGDPGSPAYAPQARELESAAQTLGVRIRLVELRNAEDLDKAFATIAESRVGALVALQNPTITGLRTRIARLAAQARLPAIYPQGEFVDAGGLVSYGPDIPDLHRQAAHFVDRILKGAKPAELPVQQPTKYELMINLGAAKQLGLAVPPQVLFRADRTID